MSNLGFPYSEQFHSLIEPSLHVDASNFLLGWANTLLHSSMWPVNSIYLLVFLPFWSYSYHPILPRSVATKTLPGIVSKLVVQLSHLESTLSVTVSQQSCSKVFPSNVYSFDSHVVTNIN